jgi:hypothetical protein
MMARHTGYKLLHFMIVCGDPAVQQQQCLMTSAGELAAMMVMV